MIESYFMTEVFVNMTVEEMYVELENYGVKREMLEKIHPSTETLSHLYLSIMKQRK